jgi:hypothetical protein
VADRLTVEDAADSEKRYSGIAHVEIGELSGEYSAEEPLATRPNGLQREAVSQNTDV